MVRFSKLLLVASSLVGEVLADTGNVGQLCGANEAACSCNWAGESESMNTTTKSLRSGIVEASRSNTGGCTSGASDYTITGWRTHRCSTEVCVTADPGFMLDASRVQVEELHCRGRRTCCHEPYTVDELQNIEGFPVPVKVPVKACVQVEAEGKKEKGVRGRGECRISATQVHP
mmetsp:Transcript_50693/g.94696  ORF Transcript_50693/g.94696 Transcript_50693/m.94696 type:complete len:174 (+) Transcript_50693:66-587(+)